MKRPISLPRVLFVVAAVVALVALGLRVSIGWRVGVINWLAVVNMAGLLVLMVVGAVEPESRRTRLAWNLIAGALILPSAVLQFVQWGSR